VGVPASWAWILLVAALSFWGSWEIPTRLPDINDVATTHLFLAPVSLFLFLIVSWLRKRDDDDEGAPSARPFVRRYATLGLWVLAGLHPISCGLYPALFDLDARTVEAVTRAVGTISVGMPRAEVDARLVAMNATLPISMTMDRSRHQQLQDQAARLITEQDATSNRQVWRELSQAPFVFIPWGVKPGEEPDRNARDQVFLRRTRATSDIGVDRIVIRYGPAFMVEEMVYSSNRQLTMERTTCTVHLIVPSSPETSFPYPCR